MKKTNINKGVWLAGGKVHGEGGTKGHNTVEAHARAETQERRKILLERAKQKRERRIDAKIKEVSDQLNQEFRPIAKQANEQLIKAHERRRITRAQYLFCYLAIDRWILERIAENFNARKIYPGEAYPEDFKPLRFSNDRSILTSLRELRRTRSAKEIREQIDKWKQRVPKIIKGHYF